MKLLGKTKTYQCNVYRCLYTDLNNAPITLLICRKDNFATAVFENDIPHNNFNDIMEWLESHWFHAKLSGASKHVCFMNNQNFDTIEFSYPVKYNAIAERIEEILIDFFKETI